MSTLAHFDSEIFSQTDEAQSSRVPIPLSDDPIRAVRQPHLVDTGIKSGPLEDLRETEIPQPLASAPSLVLLSNDPYLIEFEASELSDTRITSPHSTAPSDSTTPLSPDHLLAQTSHAPTRASYYRSTARMAVHTHPTLSLGMSARISEAPLCLTLRFVKEDTKDESLDLDTEREGSEDEYPSSEDEGHGSENEGPGSEEEEAAPEGQQHALSVVDTATDEPLGLDYGVLRRHELALEKGSVPSIFKIGQSYRSMTEQ
ncbi:hypothetical protein Tco_0756648 [Tanacetum coccineum]